MEQTAELLIQTPRNPSTLGPGIYQIDPEHYHRDPAPIPSLSCSILELLLDKTPHHAWLAHPRLNKAGWKPSSSSRKADLGSAIHEMATRRGRGIIEIDAPDYRTKAAQEARDKARADGNTPILSKDREKAKTILASLRKRVREHEDTKGAFRDGLGELTLIAQLGPGLFGRCLVDWLRPGDRTLWDLKTTSSDIGDEALRKRIASDNLDLRAAWYLYLASTLFGEDVTQWRYVYTFIEVEEPYECRFVQLSGDQLEDGREKVGHAIELWERCLRSGSWPGYPAGIETLEAPVWARTKWEESQFIRQDLRTQGRDAFAERARGVKARPVIDQKVITGGFA